MNDSDPRLPQDTPAPRRRRRRLNYTDMPAANVPPSEPAHDAPPKETAPPSSVLPSAAVNRWPRWMRLMLFALLVVILITSGVAITRRYLAVQEQRRIAQEEAALKARHPLYYREIIETAAAEQNLPPAFLCAIILCESSFDPQAESYLGARGLMQMMPDTAQWLSGKFDDIKNYTFDMMYDPEINVRFGAWYLGYLARRFDGDAVKVVCAYHAGQGNVDAWLNNPRYSSDGVTLDTIPTDDTAKYAKRVLNAYEVYQRFYYPPAADDAGADAGTGAEPAA